MPSLISFQANLLDKYQSVRNQTQFLCDPLEIEDFVVQPVINVSPLKWHLGHTTWFFENFVLVPNLLGYEVFHPKYAFLFNSYYISVGDRWFRENRGQLTRPTVKEIFKYRAYVNDYMSKFLEKEVSKEIEKIILLGINHEQQHQELFLYDIKRILGDNPLFPSYKVLKENLNNQEDQRKWLTVDEGIKNIGFHGDGFHFDNEKGSHKVFLHKFQIDSNLITNGEYKYFIEDGGYSNHTLWLSEGWDWVNKNHICTPRYWHKVDGEWWNYTLGGLRRIDINQPVSHISYYEAAAFAQWRKCRLPTEQEWEVACKTYAPEIPSKANFIESNNFMTIPSSENDFFGNLWEWTSSAYMPYPCYDPPKGALGEYNGKFMVNQMVLRGGSFGTAKNHIRSTYRNFFHPHLRWIFSGIRLAKHA